LKECPTEVLVDLFRAASGIAENQMFGNDADGNLVAVEVTFSESQRRNAEGQARLIYRVIANCLGGEDAADELVFAEQTPVFRGIRKVNRAVKEQISRLPGLARASGVPEVHVQRYLEHAGSRTLSAGCEGVQKWYSGLGRAEQQRLLDVVTREFAAFRTGLIETSNALFDKARSLGRHPDAQEHRAAGRHVAGQAARIEALIRAAFGCGVPTERDFAAAERKQTGFQPLKFASRRLVVDDEASGSSGASESDES
jgi:hypothetical protein